MLTRILDEIRLTQPALIVLFGTGDVVKRFIVRALFNLWRARRISDNTVILLVSLENRDRKDEAPVAQEVIRDRIRDFMVKLAAEAQEDFDHEAWDRFALRLHHHVSDATSVDDWQDTGRGLGRRIFDLDTTYQLSGQWFFYLATPQPSFGPILDRIAAFREVARIWRSVRKLPEAVFSVAVEKPLGTTTDEIRLANLKLAHAVPDPKYQFRVDHYLTKELVMAMLCLRFSNHLMSKVWTPAMLRRIEVMAAEVIPVSAGRYFIGAAKDMLMSHLLLVLAFLGMNRPKSEDPSHIWEAALEFLKSLSVRDQMRGQYLAGTMNDTTVPGFLDEEGVPRDSRLETCAGVRLRSALKGWDKVDLGLLSGKRLPRRRTEATLEFLPDPDALFANSQPERLVLGIGPKPGVMLNLNFKEAGPRMRMGNGPFVLQNGTARPGHHAMDPYSVLLLHWLLGIQAFFPPGDVLEAAAEVLRPTLETWDRNPNDDWCHYASGTWPVEMERRLGTFRAVEESRSQ